MYFADIYADRRIPDELRSDPVLYGECLSGALYWRDFIRLAEQAGFADPRVVEVRPVTVEDPALAAKLGDIRFWSVTCRLFRLERLDPGREDYGQAVRYHRAIPHHAQRLCFSTRQVFEHGQRVAVDRNTFRMLTESRFRPFFEFFEGAGIHRGLFPSEEARDLPLPAQRDGGCC